METGCEPPRVVAGMPMYNEEETIGTVVTMALRHVDEVICIDDGSSDFSVKKIKKIKIKNKNKIKIINNRIREKNFSFNQLNAIKKSLKTMG